MRPKAGCTSRLQSVPYPYRLPPRLGSQDRRIGSRSVLMSRRRRKSLINRSRRRSIGSTGKEATVTVSTAQATTTKLSR